MSAATVKRLAITSAGPDVRTVIPNAPSTHYLCWYCAKLLGPVFTSVSKNGETLRVHLACRAPAAELVAPVS